MKRLFLISGLIIGLLLIISSQPAAAHGTPDLRRGAALYDNWFAVLSITPPAGSHPIWARQTTNTRSGAETYRCVACHGWDYQGKDGAYRNGDRYTGFPSVLAAAQTMTEEQIIAHLHGSRDPAHDFSKFLSDDDFNDLAHFIKEGMLDDNQFINFTTRKAINGDAAKGKSLFTQGCARCHGETGATLPLKFDSQSVSLGAMANADPWRFLHKSRYGTPGNVMKTIGLDLKWTAQDGRDVLAYVQTLPNTLDKADPSGGLTGKDATPIASSSPVKDIWGGLLTIAAAMTATLGFQVILGAILVAVIFLLVWALRGRKSE